MGKPRRPRGQRSTWEPKGPAARPPRAPRTAVAAPQTPAEIAVAEAPPVESPAAATATPAALAAGSGPSNGEASPAASGPGAQPEPVADLSAGPTLDQAHPPASVPLAVVLSPEIPAADGPVHAVSAAAPTQDPAPGPPAGSGADIATGPILAAEPALNGPFEAVPPSVPSPSPTPPLLPAPALAPAPADAHDEAGPAAPFAPVRRAPPRIVFTPERLDLFDIGAVIAGYVRGEGEAAAAHLRALSGARSPADVIRLQVGEAQRAADASLTCWSAVARRAGRVFALR